MLEQLRICRASNGAPETRTGVTHARSLASARAVQVNVRAKECEQVSVIMRKANQNKNNTHTQQAYICVAMARTVFERHLVGPNCMVARVFGSRAASARASLCVTSGSSNACVRACVFACECLHTRARPIGAHTNKRANALARSMHCERSCNVFL